MNLTTKRQIAAQQGAALMWRDETVYGQPCTRFYVCYQGRETNVGSFHQIALMSAAAFAARVKAIVNQEETTR